MTRGGLMSAAGALAIVPARGGSKGVPGKNITPLCGRSLVARALDTAAATRGVGGTLLTSDSDAILAAGRLQADLCVRRPDRLAQDASPMVEVIQHALQNWHDHCGWLPDVAVLLQPTAPLRSPHDVDTCLSLLADRPDADSVVSVCEVPTHWNAQWQFVVRGGQLAPATGAALADITPCRQQLVPCYVRNGAVYAFRTEALRRTGTIYGRVCLPHIMPSRRSVNIDTPADWRIAEALLSGQSPAVETGP